MKRVSYILPIKNKVEYIDQFFANFRKSPYDELIVVDGNSTDGTKDALEKYKSQMDVFISEDDRDASEADNKGMKLASGQYIKTHSIDDILGNIDAPVRYMDDHPDIDLLILGGLKYSGDKKFQTNAPPCYGEKPFDVFMFGSCGIGFLIRRSSISRIGLFSSDYIANDREYALRAIKRGKVRYYHGIYYWHRMGSDGLYVSNRDRWVKDSWKLLRKYCFKEYCLFKISSLIKWVDVHISKSIKKRYSNGETPQGASFLPNQEGEG